MKIRFYFTENNKKNPDELQTQRVNTLWAVNKNRCVSLQDQEI